MHLSQLFYHIKPIIPRRLQLALRRQVVVRQRNRCRNIWPIDPSAGKAPDKWPGWPGGKKFAVVLSHDVDTQKGHDKCYELMQLEKNQGFRSCFNFVAERYRNSKKLRDDLTRDDFDVGVHGLKHDGKLFFSEEVFKERAILLNRYLEEWGCSGFTAPSMHHNLDWMHYLHIDYGVSTFDTDPFEPQPDGVATIFPFWVCCNGNHSGYLEMPYTLPQDHSLFVIMKNRDISIWKEKLAWIAEKGGMALLNTHPDYMNFKQRGMGIEEYPARYYSDFLGYIKTQYDGQYWHVLPKEVSRFWRQTMVPSKT